ncbi:MAG: DUF547 domain-containing protein [Flavobacteriaceae bacterium]|nr:DUF547 domain-containing protein [Flavobacteriaceae bacterium]
MKALFYPIALFGLAIVLQSCSLLSAAGLSSQGQPVKTVDEPLESTGTSLVARIDHSIWDDLLRKHVAENGLVDYKGFLEDRAKLTEYLEYLGNNAPTEDWSVSELLAYYINIYNAYTVDLIVENYPVKSIKDLNGPWTRGFVKIGDKNLSLGGIENGILRKMNEPRIHFAINCASYSCPKLLNEAYFADKIGAQLDMVTRDFINGDKNEISAMNPKLSSIFDWYRKDYEVNGEADVIAYINQYSEVKIDPSANLDYLEYNWNLNEQ